MGAFRQRTAEFSLNASVINFLQTECQNSMEVFFSEFLSVLQSANEDKYDMFISTNKICKTYSYTRWWVCSPRTTARKLVLFYRKVLVLSEEESFKFNKDETDLKTELVMDVLSNIQICKNFYNNMHNSAALNFYETIINSTLYIHEIIVSHLKLNKWFEININNDGSKEFLKWFDYYSYVNGKFPTNDNLIIIPEGNVPDFINLKASFNKVFPQQLHEHLRGTKLMA